MATPTASWSTARLSVVTAAACGLARRRASPAGRTWRLEGTLRRGDQCQYEPKLGERHRAEQHWLPPYEGDSVANGAELEADQVARWATWSGRSVSAAITTRPACTAYARPTPPSETSTPARTGPVTELAELSADLTVRVSPVQPRPCAPAGGSSGAACRPPFAPGDLSACPQVPIKNLAGRQTSEICPADVLLPSTS